MDRTWRRQPSLGNAQHNACVKRLPDTMTCQSRSALLHPRQITPLYDVRSISQAKEPWTFFSPIHDEWSMICLSWCRTQPSCDRASFLEESRKRLLFRRALEVNVRPPVLGDREGVGGQISEDYRGETILGVFRGPDIENNYSDALEVKWLGIKSPDFWWATLGTSPPI